MTSKIQTASERTEETGNREYETPTLRVGLAADHLGFDLKQRLHEVLHALECDVLDFGASRFIAGDDFPDYVIPLAEALSKNRLHRGIALCSSGIGACIAANKVPGVRASIVHDIYSAHQGVEHDGMNLICLGAEIIGPALAGEIVRAFLAARYTREHRFERRIAKIARLEGAWARNGTGLAKPS